MNARFKTGVTNLILLAGVLPLAGSWVAHVYFPDSYWVDEPFHSAVEAIAAVAAVTLAALLLSRIQFEKEPGELVCMACALIGMGVLDGAHASVHVGHEFVWLRTLATLVGGGLAAMVWLPKQVTQVRPAVVCAGLVAATACAMGVLSILMPDRLPAMTVNHHFTFTAKALNGLGGFCFLAATAHFVLRYRDNESMDALAFAHICLLLGIAALLFVFSKLWSVDWWFWHLLRLFAYTLALVYVLAIFRRTQEARRFDESRLEALSKLNQMSEAPLQVMTDFALEEAVRLTNSEIGYLAFMNDDESVLTMHAWSKTAMKECAIIDKPIVYPMETTGLWGEAVRQRKAVITNDYAAPNPLKKGYPEGHVGVHRHMNVPVFEGAKIVAVAGVGNKREPYDDTDVRQLTLLMEGMWRMIHRKRTEDELRQHRDHLEELVSQRTVELQKTNAQLLREIAERARVEKALARQAKELERSNAELQQFAYVASHDLQEPLRMVASYTQLLAQRYKGKLDADADEFIHFAVDGATRMQGLINDLLVFARVSTRGKPLAPVFCGEILDVVLANLRAAIEESGAVITHGPLPTVMGDASQLVQLFQNLLSNAIKFRGSERPRIHVAAEMNGAAWRFAVRDNGIGIESQFFDRIFVIFQRLHGRDKYPGSGIGLAVCKRIVDRHGGRIWVESVPGQGSTFYFTIQDKGTRHS